MKKSKFSEDGMGASSSVMRKDGGLRSPEDVAMVAVIGLDLAKRVFRPHFVDPETGEITKVKLTRSDMIPFFANRQPAVVAMQACGSSYHRERRLRDLGQEVRLIATKFVTPFVKGNKNDAANARAIRE